MSIRIKEGIKEYLQAFNLEKSLLFLVACKLEIEHEIDDDLFVQLIKHNIIERDYVRQKIIVKIPVFEGEETEKSIDIINFNIGEIAGRIDEYRSKFKGIRIKSIATKERCIDNIIRWMITNNMKYSFDDILKATDYYIANTERQYISNADNFIFSNDKEGKEISTLSIVIEAMEMGNIEKSFE